jgi:hypothetical protein
VEIFDGEEAVIEARDDHVDFYFWEISELYFIEVI